MSQHNSDRLRGIAPEYPDGVEAPTRPKRAQFQLKPSVLTPSTVTKSTTLTQVDEPRSSSPQTETETESSAYQTGEDSNFSTHFPGRLDRAVKEFLATPSRRLYEESGNFTREFLDNSLLEEGTTFSAKKSVSFRQPVDNRDNYNRRYSGEVGDLTKGVRELSIGPEQLGSVEDTLRLLEKIGSDEFEEEARTSKLVSLTQALVQGALDASTTEDETNPIVLQAVGALVGLLNPPIEDLLSTTPESEEFRQPEDLFPGNFVNREDQLDVFSTEEEETRRHINHTNDTSIVVSRMEHDIIRIPIFCGRSNENPREWLEKYDNIAVFKQWNDDAKLKHVPLFLDETALNWYRILDTTTKATWAAFSAKILEVFEQERYRQRVEIQLRNRIQESNESPLKYYFDVLRLCNMVEQKTGTKMDEMTKVDHLLRGLQPFLVEKLWPLVPDTIKDTSSFLSEMKRHHEAAEASRYSVAREFNNPALNLLTTVANRMKTSTPARLPKDTGPSKQSEMVTREEFNNQMAHLKKIFTEMKFEFQELQKTMRDDD